MREALGIFLSFSSKEALALEQIVHIKLLMRCIHKFQKKSEKKGADLMTVYRQLLAKATRVNLNLEEALELKDPRKRQGLASNFSQILTTVAFLEDGLDDFEPVEKLLQSLKTVTSNYAQYLNPRDMSEVVAAVCKLSIQAKKASKKHSNPIKFEKELRLLAKRSALMLAAMNKKSQDIVVDHFEQIDFYDADFTEAMKRLKMIK